MNVTLSYLFLFLSLAGAEEAFLSTLIHEDLKELPAPEFSETVSLYEFDVQMEDEESYKLLQHGYGHLIGWWDFQSYRFFIELLKREPDSLMGTTGLALALMSGDIHTIEQNQSAFKRVSELLEKGEGTEFEREFAQAVTLLAKGELKGIRKAGETLTELTLEKGKGWILPALLNAFFSRDGYTAFGEPKFHQQKAITAVKSYNEEFPEDAGTLFYYALLQAEDPKTRGVFLKEVLPTMRKLTRLYPGHPYYHFLRGYGEMRCGDPFLGEEQYREAERLYEAYRSKLGVPYRNIKPLIDAKMGVISCLILQENYEEAQAETDKLLKISLPKRDYNSQVQVAMDWEGETFPLRIACMEGDLKKMKTEADALKKKIDSVPKEKRRLHHVVWEALYFYAQARERLPSKDEEKIAESMDSLLLLNEYLLKGQGAAQAGNELLYWLRGKDLIQLLAAELKARYEMNHPKASKDTVLPWLSRVVDEQVNHQYVMPLLWLTPMEVLHGDYLFKVGQEEEALAIYDKAYTRFPNHMPTLESMQKVLKKQGKTEAVEKLERIKKNFKERAKE